MRSHSKVGGRARIARAFMAAVIGGAALTATTAGAALADEEYIPPTPQELADEQLKQALADAVGQFLDTGVWDTAKVEEITPTYCAPESGVSCAAPPSSRLLNVYARHQINATYCGPASVQAVINYTRGYFSSTLDGEDLTKNWKKQSAIGHEMGTDSAGSSSSYMIRKYLSGEKTGQSTALNPSGFKWVRSVNEDGKQMYNRIVTDVASASMPPILAVHPHKPGQNDYFLPSWPLEHTTAGHFIAIRGYSGAWNGGDSGVNVYYVDSSSNGSMQPGRYPVGAWTMWKVNSFNGKTIVW